jgi:hypothetical protein
VTATGAIEIEDVTITPVEKVTGGGIAVGPGDTAGTTVPDPARTRVRTAARGAGPQVVDMGRQVMFFFVRL